MVVDDKKIIIVQVALSCFLWTEVLFLGRDVLKRRKISAPRTALLQNSSGLFIYLSFTKKVNIFAFTSIFQCKRPKSNVDLLIFDRYEKSLQ